MLVSSLVQQSSFSREKRRKSELAWTHHAEAVLGCLIGCLVEAKSALWEGGDKRCDRVVAMCLQQDWVTDQCLGKEVGQQI